MDKGKAGRKAAPRSGSSGSVQGSPAGAKAAPASRRLSRTASGSSIGGTPVKKARAATRPGAASKARRASAVPKAGAAAAPAARRKMKKRPSSSLPSATAAAPASASAAPAPAPAGTAAPSSVGSSPADAASPKVKARSKAKVKAADEENARRAAAAPAERVRVAVRVRPVPTAAEAAGAKRSWEFHEKSLVDREDGKEYLFDDVVGASSRNAEVYDRVARPIVESVLDGFNGTVMAYGQTASGKTHTVFGTGDEQGLVPLAFAHIFDEVARRAADTVFLLRVSYVEIYQERVRDLLAGVPQDGGGGGGGGGGKGGKDGKDGGDARGGKGGASLPVRQAAGKEHFYVDGLRERVVTCPEDVARLLRQGGAARRVGVTDFNERSSRSHAVFRLVLESESREEDSAVRVSELSLVDLAGSETLSDRSGAAQQAETKHINLSLTQLKSVVTALCESAQFVPYRNSTLTKILKNSLGGNARTAIVVTMSPAEGQRRMSRGSLQFGQMAGRVSNRAHVNEFFDEDARVMLGQYKRKVRRLEDEKKRIEEDFATLRRQVDELQRREDERRELQSWSAAASGQATARGSERGAAEAAAAAGAEAARAGELARQLEALRLEMVARGIDRDASLAEVIGRHEREVSRLRREHEEALNRAAAESFQLRDEVRNLKADLTKTHRSYQAELLHLRKLLNAVDRQARDPGGVIDVEAEEERSVAVVEAKLLREELAAARREIAQLKGTR